MGPALLSVGLAGVLGLLLVLGAMSATHRWWRGRQHLGIVVGLTGLAAVSHLTFAVSWVSPVAGAVVAVLALLAAAVQLIRSHSWHHWRAALPLVLLVIGLVLLYLSIMYFWGAPAGAFSLAQQRFVNGVLPSDNYIPYLFTERLANGLPTAHLTNDWNGSDRPPLQSGLLLVVRAVAAPIAGATSGAFGASVVAQAMWIPALFALFRAVGAPRAAALAGVLMAGATGTTLVNSLFTWPKLMSAALVLSSCVFLIDARRRPLSFRRDFVLAVLAFVFAALAHGAAAFTLPLVVALGIAAWRAQPARRVISTTLAAAVAGVLAYLPWILFQRIADPPGDRLLKWHLAGVIAADDRSFTQALADSFAAKGLDGWLADRVVNIQTAFAPRVTAGFDCGCYDFASLRQAAEFSTLSAALGLALPLMLGILIVMLVRRVQGRRGSWLDRVLLLEIAGSVVCILLWCVLMFLPGATVIHQGSQVWIFLLLAAPVAWLAVRHRRIALGVVAAQFALTLAVYLPRAGETAVDPLAASTAVAAVAVVVVATMTGIHPRRPKATQ